MPTTTPADFDAFYAQTSRRVLQHVYAVCGDVAEAQDIVQDVAWRLAAKRWRGLHRWFAARARLGQPPFVAGPTPDRVAVVDALLRISRVQREMVVMHYLLDMPIAEIAAATGIPIGTIKVRLARARTALAPLLRDIDEEIIRVQA
jgi:RNA polymerase sigma-70 factor (ECF subfamily)